MRKNKDNYISAAKAIAIILMVVAHSCPPPIVSSFIALFHMPVFFFYSGYFFRKAENWSDWRKFAMKRIKGLYFPYLKWSIAFLLLHNLLYKIHIYNEDYVYYNVPQYLYDWHDFFLRMFFIVTSMDYHEQLLGGFWFLKVLLLASILISLVLFMVKKINKLKLVIIALLLWAITIVLKLFGISLPLFGNLYIITFGALFYMAGYIYKHYEKNLQIFNKAWPLYFIILLLVSAYYGGGLSMTSLNYQEISFYPILALMGISLTATISKRIECTWFAPIFYYIGKHTMPILAMHMTAFKLVSLIKIEQYSMSIEHLAEFPVISSSNSLYWVAYSICGVSVPLLIYYFYIRTANSCLRK